MKNTKLALLFIAGFTLFSCQPKFNLKSDKHLTEIFTDNELKEIEKMIHYVDNMVIENTGNKDIEQAYHQLFDEIDKTMQDSSKFLVPFEEEQKYKFLQSLDIKVFNEFWTFRRVGKAMYQDSIYENGYQFLELSINGRYVADYLERIGKQDDYYKSEIETIKMAGGLAPTTKAWFLKNHSEFDFTIPKNRLWATVFILSIEEPHDRKMEMYLNGKKN